jgi:pimeloyl-ACP methyl ester carboxylesterase
MELTVAGHRAFASTGGQVFDPKLPAAVFLHGAGMDHSVWSLPARYFAGHGRAVLALDFPGHGRSAGAPLGSVEAMADWVLAAMAAAGLARAALVGHSMGALVALEASARGASYVEALALLGVGAEMPVHPDLMAAARANDPKAIQLIVGWAHGSVGHIGGTKAPGLWTMGGGVRPREAGRARRRSRGLRRLQGRAGGGGEVQGASAADPGIAGSHDAAEGREAARRAPAAGRDRHARRCRPHDDDRAPERNHRRIEGDFGGRLNGPRAHFVSLPRIVAKRGTGHHDRRAIYS